MNVTPLILAVGVAVGGHHGRVVVQREVVIARPAVQAHFLVGNPDFDLIRTIVRETIAEMEAARGAGAQQQIAPHQAACVKCHLRPESLADGAPSWDNKLSVDEFMAASAALVAGTMPKGRNLSPEDSKAVFFSLQDAVVRKEPDQWSKPSSPSQPSPRPDSRSAPPPNPRPGDSSAIEAAPTSESTPEGSGATGSSSETEDGLGVAAPTSGSTADSGAADVTVGSAPTESSLTKVFDRSVIRAYRALVEARSSSSNPPSSSRGSY